MPVAMAETGLGSTRVVVPECWQARGGAGARHPSGGTHHDSLFGEFEVDEVPHEPVTPPG